MNIAVFGANGRVGSRVCILARSRGHIVWEIDKGTDLKNIGNVDVVIDFSTAAATETVCYFCKAHQCKLVSGVTGRDEHQQEMIEELKQHTTVIENANFSKGIALLEEICVLLARQHWDCEIVETHRKGKADIPSGTAKKLAVSVMKNGTRIVRVHSLRCGSNFGKHEIVFATEGESITITHQAENVDIFANGALDAAEQLI